MTDLPPSTPVHQEMVIERSLRDCGLDGRGLSVKYEDYLQSIEIVISPEARASRDHFECIQKVTMHEIVTFKDTDMQSAYNDFLSELYRPQMMAEAKRGVEKFGLLSEFPRRSSFKSLDEYARALETHSGVSPGTALKVRGEDVVFDPPRIENYQEFSKLYSGLLASVMYASAIGDLAKFGFIGNEAFAVPDQPR